MNELTPSLVLQILVAVMVIVGGLWGVIKMLLSWNRKSSEERAADAARINEDARKALLRRLDDLRTDVVNMQIAQGVLRERVNSMPDHDVMHERFRDLEEKMDKKLDYMLKQVQETFSLAASKFKCPYDTNSGSTFL